MRSAVSPFRTAMLCVLIALGIAPFARHAGAATATGNFQVRITIQESCIIVGTPSPLDFGNQNVLAANVDAVTTLTVQCTTSTPYNIGLNAGTGAGATIAVRKMTGPGAATVDYSLYQDTSRTVLWGDVIGTNTEAGTGNGSPQAYTVYGRVPPQPTPAPGLYTDTITVTVTY
jgi:spore coat protein U-like protein